MMRALPLLLLLACSSDRTAPAADPKPSAPDQTAPAADQAAPAATPAAAAADPAAASAPAVGGPAPEFSLPGSDGKTHSLAQLRGQRAVVLAWFPKAFTGGCTAECKSFSEGGDQLRQFDADYFAVSTDPADENKRFAESVGADYPILSDPTTEIARAYGVLKEDGKRANRWTFYIGKDGNILHIDREVKPASAAQDVASRLESLGIAKRPPT